MLEILQNFESSMGAARLSPPVLIGSGLTGVALGLFVWLGGLGFKKVLVAIGGAVCGGIVGFFVIRRGTVAASIVAAIAAIITITCERVSLALLTGAVAASVSFAVLAGPTVGGSQTANLTGRDEASAQAAPIDSGPISEQLKTYVVDVGETVKRAASQLPLYKWAITAALAAVFMAGAFIFRRLIPALCFSVLGTGLVFFGMILLLVYKGAAPVSRMSMQPLTYTGVFAAMTVFGTVEQVLLCRGAKTQMASKQKAAQGKQGAQKKRRSWRMP
jgi:hypothetical protein